MFAKVVKRYAFSNIDKIFNADFYKTVYAREVGARDPLKHFLKNYKTLKFDPCPEISLSNLITESAKFSPDELLETLCSDADFFSKHKGVSSAVFKHFGMPEDAYVVKCCSLVLQELDEEYYLRLYPDVAKTWMPAHVHYVVFGAYEGRNPNHWFESTFYLSENDDVRELRLNPLAHYMEFGRSEGRCANPAERNAHTKQVEERKRQNEAVVVNPDYYLESNPDVKAEGLDPEAHYYEFGEREGRMPNRYFDPYFYTSKYDDVSESGMSALDHYRDIGVHEKRETLCRSKDYSVHKKSSEEVVGCPETTFDAEYYLRENPDVSAAGVDPFSHYLSSGEREGRAPNEYFCPIFYRRINADVRFFGISPFEHYCNFGYSEGRLGKAPATVSRSKIKKPLLFVGHDGIQAGSQIVLLEVIKWFYLHTDRAINVLLLSPGTVANQYAKYADVFVLPDYSVDDRESLAAFIGQNFEFVYINTVVSGCFFSMLEQHEMDVSGDIVAHIHEMEKVIEENIHHFEKLKPNVRHWISASPASSQDLERIYGVSPDNITTVPAFIKPVVDENTSSSELRTQVRNELGLSRDAIVVAGCGTVYWRKGPDLFLGAARKLISETAGNVQFLWVGDGPDFDDIKNSLSEEEKGLVKFIGSSDQASRLLASADIFFLSSREDPFPLVVMEAAQHGVPSVCFEEATGITEFVKNDAGICVENIDIEAAVVAIRKLIVDPALRGALGAKAKLRVFEKYIADKQCLNIYTAIRKNTGYLPSVSIAVPFYNHEKFAAERVSSILEQTVKDIEIILMDDCSSDDTVPVVEQFLKDPRVEAHHNSKNSGSPFKQWKKGLSLSSSDVVWIAEGDDFCTPNFLEVLLPYFDDPMMAIAFSKTQIVNENGELVDGALDPYLNDAYPGKFESNYVKDGFQEVNESFGAMCTLVNASGLLLRKSFIDDGVLEEAGNFKMCGDWYVYLSALREGKIAYDTCAENFFRRHSASAVHRIEGTKTYFDERVKIAQYVFNNFTVDHRLAKRAVDVIDSEWNRFSYKHEGIPKKEIFDRESLLQSYQQKQQRPHIAFYVHGMLFSKGGIERLAADLANKFVSCGYKVSIYCKFWGDAKPVYPVFESVNVRGIFDESDLAASIPRLRKCLLDDSVDVFIPMLSEWIFEPVIAAAENTGIRIIASEHNDPDKIVELWWDRNRRIETFEKVDCVHLILDVFKASLPDHLQERTQVIPNFVKPVRKKSISPMREKVIIAVGRLAPQKRMDRLVSAFSLLAKDYPDWKVRIYGEGQQEAELRELIHEKDLKSQVMLMGLSDDIHACLKSSSIFVIPSEFEAFGIVVAEAQQSGLPCIGYSSCNGPNVLIEHGLNGFLADDSAEDVAIESLSNYLARLMSCSRTRDVFGEVSASSVKKFELSRVFGAWEKTVESVF